MAVVLDLSQVAGEPLNGTERSRLDLVRAMLPAAMRATTGDLQAALITLSGPSQTCSDNVHVLSNFRPASEIEWENLLTPIQPEGVVSLAEGLLQAADMFPSGARRPILLISAGSTLCGDDPCQVARVLERAEADVSVHVIDLSTGGTHETTLRCIAQASGGAYYRVRTPEELANALQDALTHALGGQIRVEVVGAEGHPLFPAVVVGKAAQVVRTFDAWTDADLAAGHYVITVGTPIPLVFPDVSVRGDERTRLHILLGELRLVLSDPTGDPLPAQVTISRPDLGPFFSRSGSQITVPLPTGRYTATIRVGTAIEPIAYARDLLVIPGNVTERRITLPVGWVFINLTRANTTATALVEVTPVEAPDLIAMAGWAEGSIETVLPEGEYRIRVSRYTGEGVFLEVDNVRVLPGKRLTFNLDLGNGTLRVARTATDGHTLTGRVRVFARETEHLIAEADVDVPISLPAGEYDARIETDEGETLWVWRISIRAGEEQAMTVQRPQARLWARVVDPMGQTLSAWGGLSTLEGNTIREGRLPTRWIVPPGRYTLEVTGYDVLGSTRRSDVFDLTAGDAFTLSLPVDVATLTIAPANADRVRVTVFSPDDEMNPMGEVIGALPSLRLPPGTYNIRVQEMDELAREAWVEGVILTSGETREVHVQLE